MNPDYDDVLWSAAAVTVTLVSICAAEQNFIDIKYWGKFKWLYTNQNVVGDDLQSPYVSIPEKAYNCSSDHTRVKLNQIIL